MKFADILASAERMLSGGESNRIGATHDCIASILKSRGILIGVTEVALSTPSEFFCRGCIVDICYHPYYGNHLVFIPRDHAPGEAVFITADTTADISPIV